ncbi:MAG: excinuclease ABC subunit UvrC [bacterium]|nr:excinuclease ABC subunit UvrC [bacterium]
MEYRLDELGERLGELPEEPGVYVFRNDDEKALYVGKANVIPKRLQSYAKVKPDGDPKTATMLSEAERVEVIYTHTPSEALLLEMNLIKRYTPRYNISIHGFPYVKISDESFPLLNVSRENPARTPGRFLGPFTDATNLRRTVNLINRAFTLRTCHYDLDKNPPKRACLDYEMGLCDAPCIGVISPDDYMVRIESARKFVEGKRHAIFNDLERRMKKAAADLDYEEAAKYRDMISALRQAARGQRVVSRSTVNLDAAAIEVYGDELYCIVLKVREGLLIDKLEYVISAPAGDTVEAFLLQYYGSGGDIPPVVLLKRKPDDTETITDFLTEKRGGPAKIAKPYRGKKTALLAMAYKNLKYLIESRSIDKARRGELDRAIRTLGESLELTGEPRHIELIDVSNTGPTAVVASLVAFVDGIPDKTRYRRYRIKGLDGQDDFAAIAQVTRRRFKRVKSGEETPPDLFVVDGGKGQLSAAENTLDDIGFPEQPLAAITKGDGDELYVPGKSLPLEIPGDALLLLSRIRDEAHRFAITYHRKLRGKKIQRSILDDVAGVGPRRKKILLRHFGSVEKLAGASPDEIGGVNGIPKNVAKAVYNRLHGGRDDG